MDATYDVVVVGGGAAGLAAALTLGRARRTVLVVDAGAPRNAPAGHVHNYLGREGTPPGELLAIGRDEVARHGGEVVPGTVVSATRVTGPPAGDAHPDGAHVDGAADATEGARFRVVLADGTTVGARRLLVTTGLVDELPEVPGVASGGDATSCTARTATGGRSATSRSASWPAAPSRCTRRCCSGSGATT